MRETSVELPPLKRLVLLGAALVIVALAAVLRLEGLGRDGLWFDETVSLGYARQPLSYPGHWNNGMALFHTVLHGWIRIAGESEAALRFPSAVFGIAAVALLIALVRRVNGWTAALAAGLIFALAWRHVYYSQEARGYSLFIMLAILTTLLLVRLLERPGTGRLVAYGIALVALAYSHYQWVFVVVFHNLVVLISRRRVGWGWLWLHCAVAAAYVPQIVLGLLPHTGWSPHYIGRYPRLGEALWCVQDAFGLPLQRAIVGPLPGGSGLNVLAVYLLPLVVIAGVAACLVPLAVRLVPALKRGLPITGINFRATTDEEISKALAWDEPPERVWLVVSHNPTPVIIDYFKRRPDYRLVRDYDTQFLEIDLFLFEQTAAQSPLEE